jgi:uncharacterized OsmC-like protein/esterase/lipase
MSFKTEKFDFKNSAGETLSGSMELPINEPKAFALLAHCFTCSKNLMASSRIAKHLTDHQIAVLRFDFTGLGNSEGDFSNTNFSSNVDDLISACTAIKDKFGKPAEILIGHSLGGAAVLKAAQTLSGAKAVVTIGAPGDTHHVAKLFDEDVETIENEGKAVVNLAGREFTIKKQFIEDIKEQDILSGVGEMKKALMVIHSPVDNTVSIDHAKKIYEAARHPKSFLSLDTADHLVSNPEDAEYVASMIGAWVKKYVDLSHCIEVDIKKGNVKSVTRFKHKFTTDIYSPNHQLTADEPKNIGGDDLGMSPYELLLSSLAACTSMTIRMYTDRKGWTYDKLEVELSHEKETLEDGTHRDVLYKNIIIEGDLDEAQIKRIKEIAEKCPVNKTLKQGVRIEGPHL